jgi:MoaA/NifB/PqqE/SkfB family radical SAM enzyme
MSQNNLDKIYEEFGSNICLFPFVAGFYALATEENKKSIIMPCSDTSVTGWDIHDKSILTSMNSQQWVQLRKNFITGSCHTSEFCKCCSLAEVNGGDSPRKLANQYFTEHLNSDIIETVKNIINNDYKITKILSLDYSPSNYCNYECIMCFGGASTARRTFEIKMMGKTPYKIIKKDYHEDFHRILDNLELLNLAGGEPIQQKQVHEVIDYLISNDIAKNLTISVLTHVGKYPKNLQEKFKQFKNVFYTLSIDGIEDVIEYQRRGAIWQDVEANTIQLQKEFGCVINYVLTAVNVFSFDQFVDWIHTHNMDRVIISLVYESNKNLSVDVIPLELKTPLIEKLQLAKNNYTNERYIKLFDRVIDILVKANYNETLLLKFIEQIYIEDQVSKKKLVDVVPEWKSYFE